MAYIVGIISDKEAETLKARGWDLEEAPEELRPVDHQIPEGYQCKMVFVDNGMFDIMSGPDWDTEEFVIESNITEAEVKENVTSLLQRK